MTQESVSRARCRCATGESCVSATDKQPDRGPWSRTFVALTALAMTVSAWAQEGDNPPQATNAELKTEQTVATAEKVAEPRKHLTSKAFGARLETDPPGYVKPMSLHGERYGIESWKSLTWLDFGLEHTTRFELRDDYYYRGAPENRDAQFLMRSRMYLGVHDIIDPFRFAVEFQDARQFMSEYDEDNRDVDEADILQMYGELHFKDAIGPGQPLRLQVGRMTWDLIDRKLVGRNRWRNTVNAFDGFRLQLGQPSSDWQLDVLAAMPVERRIRKPDRAEEERWFFGLVGAWRKWSQYATLEPYYFILDEDRKDPDRSDREIHTLGLHAFGPIAGTRFDYDIDTAFQFGDDGQCKHRAFAAYGELGYTFDHDWKPRLSVSGTYGSGDRDPTDNTTQRFDRLFAPNHFRAMSDYFNWQNTTSPKLRLEFQPFKSLRIDTAYGAYWLASDSDAWTTPGRRDPLGQSGDFVGQEIELRARYKLTETTELEAGYSCFIPGGFVQNTGPADDSDLLYMAVTIAF